MEIFIILIVITSVVVLLVKAGIKKASQEENNTNNRQSYTPQIVEEPQIPQHLEKPSNEYSYYELVGMKYRKLTRNDLGIFDGYAFAEDDNEYDKYAVGIYRKDNNKLIAYVPKDFRGKSNKDLHDKITNLGGSTPAKFRISESNGNLYGIAYIKEE